jgi:endosialidase-like protein
MNRSPLRLGFLLTVLVLAVAWLAPLQLANAQCPQICDSNLANTALGVNALPGDTGQGNTAIGWSALDRNTTGIFNTATGYDALVFNTAGIFNTAIGAGALNFNTTGNFNTASGDQALLFNTTGNHNTAIGFNALLNNTTGSFNIAVGNGAGANLTTGGNNIDIGNRSVAGEANTIRIGKQGTQRATFIAGISGATVPTGIAVVIDTDGHLGTTTSSARFKDEIKPMAKSSEAILSLTPVTFRYKKDIDPEATPQFGLVAEDVAKVDPNLVARDDSGKPYTVRYEAVNAMLLNEFLKKHRKSQEQDAAISQLKAELAQQQKEINALTVGLREQASQIQEATRPRRVEVSKFATGRIRRGGPISQMVADRQ